LENASVPSGGRWFFVWRSFDLERSICAMTPVIYHNPSCGTSRKVLGFLREAGFEPKIVLYLKEPPDKALLTELLARMGMKPRALLRKRGTPYEELGLGDESLSDADLIEAMVKHPILIERPIVTTDKAAVLCRPPERVYELLPGGANPVKAGKAKSK
jgi:arsenate reductase